MSPDFLEQKLKKTKERNTLKRWKNRSIQNSNILLQPKAQQIEEIEPKTVDHYYFKYGNTLEKIESFETI